MNLEGYILNTGQPTGLDPEQVSVVGSVLRFYGADLGPLDDDVAARAILAARAWQERQAADERAHAKRRAVVSYEASVTNLLAEARRRAQLHSCGRCADHYSPGGVER